MLPIIKVDCFVLIIKYSSFDVTPYNMPWLTLCTDWLFIFIIFSCAITWAFYSPMAPQQHRLIDIAFRFLSWKCTSPSHCDVLNNTPWPALCRAGKFLCPSWCCPDQLLIVFSCLTLPWAISHKWIGVPLFYAVLSPRLCSTSFCGAVKVNYCVKICQQCIAPFLKNLNLGRQYLVALWWGLERQVGNATTAAQQPPTRLVVVYLFCLSGGTETT